MQDLRDVLTNLRDCEGNPTGVLWGTSNSIVDHLRHLDGLQEPPHVEHVVMIILFNMFELILAYSILLSQKSQEEDHWKKLEESRQQQFKMLQHGLMSRDNAQKMMLNEALRTGTTVCILRQNCF